MIEPNAAVARLVDIYHEAPEWAIEEGVGWYRALRTICADIGRETGHPLPQVVWALAALSPLTSIGRNIAITRDACLDPEFRSHPHASKAIGILWHDAESDLLGNRKTRCFAENILNGGQSQRVTVDSWAYRAMTGDIIRSSNGRYAHDNAAYRRATQSDKAYAECESIYRIAARQCGRYPANFQAIIWCTVRKEAW